MNADTIDYQADAKERLAKASGKIRWRLTDTKQAPWSDEESRERVRLRLGIAYRPHYRVTLTGPGGSYSFDFWGSLADGADGKDTDAYSILACLQWHCSEDFADFCAEFGYEEDSRKAHQTWKACLAQSRSLARIFPSEQARETLAQIA